MDDLARQLAVARGDGIGHQNMLSKLGDVNLTIIDDFLMVASTPTQPPFSSRFWRTMLTGADDYRQRIRAGLLG
ncbi:hypothetical protein E3T55_16220 [Cryobacterium frigoriphilum]|uniref:Uncharacterized protein n=1 Tax=Cryobacterium frigoriphilum TaxID=1259150 RepID=A0A4V3IQI9_9MICO|nr:hypothetical protein [Cryobacterium frigoriphilum]TFD46918.1 hypothetical protein E3T55_16220 [Cryobacterium frigoriphilum]